LVVLLNPGRSKMIAQWHVSISLLPLYPNSVRVKLERGASHFFSPGIGRAGGYFARSACHFVTSSGLFVAVYRSMRR